MTTGSQSRAPRPNTPQRRHARSNRARLLAAARTELSRDPDVSLDEIARAAGVVRRTLYGHFPNREALIDALATESVVLTILEGQASAGEAAPPTPWSDPHGEAAATAVLITAGVEPAAARRYVRAALRPDR